MCYSLFYDYSKVNEGETDFKMPYRGTCPPALESKMKVIQKEYKYLPKETYAGVVENTTLICVDILCRRKKDGKLLLFYRRDKPANFMWWCVSG